MKAMSKMRGLLAFVLIFIVIFTGFVPLTGTSYATEADHFAYVIGYPDGLIRPVSPMTREEAAVIFYRLLPDEKRISGSPATQTFPDVSSDRWSYSEINTMVKRGILEGYPDGSFCPAKPITRAEFAVMAAKFDNIDGTSESQFPDTVNHWAEDGVNSAALKGWIKGFGDGSFRPDQNIIRCEAMMRINEVLDRRVNLAGIIAEARQWPDNPTEKWYHEIVMEATNTHDYERENRPRSTEKWLRIKSSPVW